MQLLIQLLFHQVIIVVNKESMKLKNAQVPKTTQSIITEAFKKVLHQIEYLLYLDRLVSIRTQANIDVSNS